MSGNFENLKADLELYRPRVASAAAAQPNRFATYFVGAVLFAMVCAQAAMLATGIIRP
jgi:hypothetical protein